MAERNLNTTVEKLKKLDEENLKLIDIGAQFLLLSQGAKEHKTQELKCNNVTT